MRFICGISFLIVAVHFKSKQSNLMGWGVIIFQKTLFQIPLVLQVTSFSFRMYAWQSLWLTPRHKCTFLGKSFASSNSALHQDLCGCMCVWGLFCFCFYLQKEYLFKCCIKSLWRNSGPKWWIWAWALWIAKYISPQWILWYLGFQWSVKCSAHLKSCLQAIHVRWHNRQWFGFAKHVYFTNSDLLQFDTLAYYIFISSRFRKLSLGAFQSSLQRVTNAVFLGNLLNGILKTGLSKFLFL